MSDGVRRISVFDTTLRDGEQAPGFSMTTAEKLTVARQLARLGVDVIEAGFPASSPGDFDAVRRVATEVGGVTGAPVIAGLARCHERDIESCRLAVSPARRGRIHVFLATSEAHLTHKLRLTKKEVLARAVQGVRQAAASGLEVEFSPEDALRSEYGFLEEVVAATVDAGATIINLPDTVGYATPSEMETLVHRLLNGLPELENIVLSVHCHDDLGLALANSLAAVEAGASQVECTLNGIGERAGNASLEEFVMTLATRRDRYQACTGINTKEIAASSRAVVNVTGIDVAPNKAVVGANAFAHEAGIHQDGMLKHRSTYEIMRPQDVGRGAGELVLGKHSGRAALESRLRDLGYRMTEESLALVFSRFKILADTRKRVDDDELAGLARSATAAATAIELSTTGEGRRTCR